MTTSQRQLDVAVVGLGYVGMPAFLMLANAGIAVAGVDVDAGKIDRLQRGEMPLDDEPGFAELLQSAIVKQGTLALYHDMPSAKAYMIAVPTPLRHGRHTADVTYVEAALRAILPKLERNALVIINSTCPPLTCKEVAIPILEQSGLKAGVDFQLAYCPERLYPGNIVHEIVANDHIIGGIDARSTASAKKIYQTFVKGELIETDALTAEFCKLIENTFRDVNIALANELAAISESLGTNIWEAISIANRHPRVSVLSPGIGVGGHCLPIDPWFLVESCPRDSTLIAAARRINNSRPAAIAAKLRKKIAASKALKIGLYGLTYKPNVNDIRESPAVAIRDELVADGFQVASFDPVASVGTKMTFEDFVSSCDIVFILVKHNVLDAEISRLPTAARSKLSDFSLG